MEVSEMNALHQTALPASAVPVHATSCLNFQGFTKSGEPKHLHPSGSTIFRKLFHDCTVYLQLQNPGLSTTKLKSP